MSSDSDRRLALFARGLPTMSMLDLVGILTGGVPGPGPLPVPAGIARALDLPARRRELASRFSWAIPSPAALGLIADHGPILEVGAGTGYWASLLAPLTDVVATDIAPGVNPYHRDGHTWFPVAAMPAVAAVHAYPGRTLLLCWPPPDDDAAGYAAVRAYRGDTVLLIGGDEDGPVGTARLHRELELNWTVTDELALPWWPGIPDRLTVWARNGQRRPLRVRDRCPSCRRFIPTGTFALCDRCAAVPASRHAYSTARGRTGEG